MNILTYKWDQDNQHLLKTLKKHISDRLDYPAMYNIKDFYKVLLDELDAVYDYPKLSTIALPLLSIFDELELGLKDYHNPEKMAKCVIDVINNILFGTN